MSCAVCVRDIGPAMRRPHSRLQHQPHLSLGNPHTSCIARLSCSSALNVWRASCLGAQENDAIVHMPSIIVDEPALAWILGVCYAQDYEFFGDGQHRASRASW